MTQIITFVHELSEARPLRGTAAVARAPRNGTEAPAASRRPRIPRPPNQPQPCLTAQHYIQLRSRLSATSEHNTHKKKNNVTNIRMYQYKLRCFIRFYISNDIDI